MAVGDVVSDIQNIAAGAFLTFQPSVGVEVLITGVSSDRWIGVSPVGTYNMDILCRTGAIIVQYCNPQGQRVTTNLRLFLNNSWYLYLFNPAGAAGNLAYWGTQIK